MWGVITRPYPNCCDGLLTAVEVMTWLININNTNYLFRFIYGRLKGDAVLANLSH